MVSMFFSFIYNYINCLHSTISLIFSFLIKYVIKTKVKMIDIGQ